MRRTLTALVALVCVAILAPSPAPAPTPGRAAPLPTASAPAPAPTPMPTPTPWAPGTAAAREFAARRAGVVAFAVRTPERLWGVRFDRATRSASVVKAMLMLAYLRRPDVAGRELTREEQLLLAPMIQWSSNDAANRVHALVGAEGLRRLAARAGMARFAPAPAWGMSRITAADQTRLFLRLERLTPARHRAYVLRLLRTVVPGQRWGIAKAAPAGWHLHFKGGWGGGTGEVSHQVALLRRGDERIAVAILTEDNPSHEYAARTLRGVAARLLRGL